jgi:hypothetical protein
MMAFALTALASETMKIKPKDKKTVISILIKRSCSS